MVCGSCFKEISHDQTSYVFWINLCEVLTEINKLRRSRKIARLRPAAIAMITSSYYLTGWDNKIRFVGTRGLFQMFRTTKRELLSFKTILMESTHQQCPYYDRKLFS